MIVRREVEFGSPAMARLIALRREVLRLPLGLDFTDEELRAEAPMRHLALFSGDDQVVAVAVVVPGDPAKVRQVAVRPADQGRGLGREIMTFAEDVAREAGATTIYLHARAEVVPFYLRLGYQLEGGEFVEVGIPHRKMIKPLT